MGDNAYIYFDVRDSKEFLKQEKSKNMAIKPNFNLQMEDGKEILGTELLYLGRGENSTVWKYESEGKKYAVKIFFDIGKCCALTKDVYRLMKNLPLENTLKALETLNIVNYDGNTTIKKYYAYIMRFLEERTDYSIVEMPTSKLLENSSTLESDCETLARNHITMHDLKRENTIFNKEDSMLYLIDIDMFSVNWDEFSNIREYNYGELNFLFYHFFIQYSDEHYDGIYNNLFTKLFYKDVPYKKSITEKLEHLFSSYDTPKQFFKDNKERYSNKHF